MVDLSLRSLAISRDHLKGAQNLGGGLFGARLLHSFLSPVRAMFDNPIEQSLFKADVLAGFFAFDPFVLKNLFPLGKEFFVEDRIFYELRLVFLWRWGGHIATFSHKPRNKSIISSN